jgi:hypothetical protein
MLFSYKKDVVHYQNDEYFFRFFYHNLVYILNESTFFLNEQSILFILIIVMVKYLLNNFLSSRPLNEIEILRERIWGTKKRK